MDRRSGRELARAELAVSERYPGNYLSEQV
jgi:hypothetical protein